MSVAVSANQTTRPGANDRPRTHFVLGVALALIAEHRCPCLECDGSLAQCEYASWRRCTDCKCCWKIGHYPVGRRADYVRGRCRKEDRPWQP